MMSGCRDILSQGIRAASWWSELRDLQWPSSMADERINRRADAMAATGVNMAIQYGFHFRWDYLPVMERVHGYLGQVRESLDERGIIFVDHHSSVLVHRLRSIKDREDIQRHNAHHVPFYLDPDYADGLRFNGMLLNDWMMISTHSDKTHYNESYNNRQFCMNNPDFQQAYRDYLKRLIDDTGIQALMSDDAIFYPGWEVCDCRYCREKFFREYGVEQPSDLWRLKEESNLFQEAEIYRDVVTFRLRTVEEFIVMVKETIGPDVMLATCCSRHNHPYGALGSGMSAEGFSRHCDFLMHEICSPEERLLNWPTFACDCALFESLAVAEDIPYLPLAYVHSHDLAGLAWGISKFWGDNLWLSTQKARLHGNQKDIEALPEDAGLWEDIGTWEKEHADLFAGQPATRLALYYNVPSREFGPYTSDVSQRVCCQLVEADIQFKVISPAELLEDQVQESTDVLLLLNTECLSQAERTALTIFASAEGKQVIVLGRAGIKDETGKLLPEDINGIEDKAICLSRQAELKEYLQYLPPAEVQVSMDEDRWRWRIKRDRDNWIIIFLATGAEVEHHDNIHNATREAPVIRRLLYKEAPTGTALKLKFPCFITQTKLYSSDIDEVRAGNPGGGNRISFDLSGLKSFFIVRAGMVKPD